MSVDENVRLLERAADLLDEIDGHPSRYDKLLERALIDGDMDAIRHCVSIIEGELSRDHFSGYDILVGRT